jgi:hypothetical protein
MGTGHSWTKKGDDMREWTFSATAEWVVGALLVATIVATILA